MRRSVTARGVDGLLTLVSPQNLATLPERLGGLSRRWHVLRPHRKEVAVGVFRSVTQNRPFDPRIVTAPLGLLLRKTASQPVKLLARAAAGALAAAFAAATAVTATFWSVLFSPWKLFALLWGLWNRLLDSADSSYRREIDERDSRRSGGDVSTLFSSVETAEREESGDRGTAWTFAAITGVVGVILLFLLQFSGPKPESGTTEASVVSRPVKKERPARKVTETADTRSRNEPRVPEQFVPMPEVLELPRTELIADEKPVDRQTEPVVDPLPEVKPAPRPLDVAWIAIRRERVLATELPVDDFHVRSERPREESRTETAISDDWNRFVTTASATTVVTKGLTYAERLHPIDRQRIESDLSHTPASADSVPNATEAYGAVVERPPVDSAVQLEVEKRLPERGTTGESFSMELIVRNAGTVSLPYVRIDDLVSDVRAIEDVSPLGVVKDGMVQWALGPLPPGEKQTLRVRMAPSAEGSLTSTTRVKSFATVSFQTEVAGPKLALEVTSPERLNVGDACPIKFKITNTGEAKAMQVVLRESLPAELKHDEGRLLDHDLGSLEPGESREAQLTVTASAAGTAVHEAKLLVDGKVRGEAVERNVVIAERRPVPKPARPAERIERPAPQKPPEPQPQRRPSPERSYDPCRQIDPCRAEYILSYKIDPR